MCNKTYGILTVQQDEIVLIRGRASVRCESPHRKCIETPSMHGEELWSATAPTRR